MIKCFVTQLAHSGLFAGGGGALPAFEIYYDSGLNMPLDGDKAILPQLFSESPAVVVGDSPFNSITIGKAQSKSVLFAYYGTAPSSPVLEEGISPFDSITTGKAQSKSTLFIYYGTTAPTETEKTITGAWEFDSGLEAAVGIVL